MSDVNTEVMALLLVGLDAMREQRHVAAELIWDQLDSLDPNWHFQITFIAPSCRKERLVARQANARAVLMWVLNCAHAQTTVAHDFGVTRSRVQQLVTRGAAVISDRVNIGLHGRQPGRLEREDPNARRWEWFGDLEEDFKPEAERRALRRKKCLDGG